MFWILAWDIDGKCYTYSFFFLRQKEGEPYQKAPERIYALHERDASRGASRMYA